MATVTGLTAERMLEIEAASIIDGKVVDGDLILIKHDGTELNAGPVDGPSGPQGPPGPPGIAAIPGEVKLWSGDVLPEEATYGKWVWADGAYYPIANYPLAAAHISDAWNTFAGASDPGPSNFRVPDLRGLVATGMDAMPGGSRANRMTRSVAITLAARTGKETHAITSAEMAYHSHGGGTGHDTPDHAHGGTTGAADRSLAHSHTVAWNRISTGRADGTANQVTGLAPSPGGNMPEVPVSNGGGVDHLHSFWTGGANTRHAHPINPEGGNIPHENVQPTVFVPYIVCLGG